MKTEITNLLLDETEGAGPEVHLEMMARQRENDRRYAALRAYAVLCAISPELADEIGERLADLEDMQTAEQFDQLADALVVEMSKVRGGDL